jgi:hypothetical protein
METIPGTAAEPDAAAVPVALALGNQHGESVRRWLEGTLGWQAVDDDPDGPVPPAIRVLDLDGAVRLLTAPAGGALDVDRGITLPAVLLVVDGDPPARVAEAARRLTLRGGLIVCRWPQDGARLPDLVARMLRAPRPDAPRSRTLRIGGAAGGVGTTTVALALTGLSAWSGRRTLAVVHGQTGARSAFPVPADALSAPDLWSRATPLIGVPDGRVVHTGDRPPAAAPTDRRIDVRILDVGVDVDPDVLVCRPDGAAADVLRRTIAGAVVVVGTGLLSPARIRALAGGRTLVLVPTSVRVARAVLRGQAPAGLPGSWLAPLAPLIDSTRHDGPSSTARRSTLRRPRPTS